MNTRQKIEVMEGWEAGEKIKCASNTSDFTITVQKGLEMAPLWDWMDFTYSVVKEPKEMWVNEYKSVSTCHLTKEAAIHSCTRSDGTLGGGVVRPAICYREVIESGDSK